MNEKRESLLKKSSSVNLEDWSKSTQENLNSKQKQTEKNDKETDTKKVSKKEKQKKEKVKKNKAEKPPKVRTKKEKVKAEIIEEPKAPQYSDPIPEDMYFFTNDWIPYSTVTYGMIVTKDNRYIKAIRILPTNYAYKSNEEKNNIISCFKAFLSVAPDNLHFKAFSVRSNTEENLDLLDEKLKNETNELCLARAKEYRELIKGLSSNDAITTEYYVFFEYKKKGFSTPPVETIAEEMYMTERNLVAYLEGCGNTCITTLNGDSTYFQLDVLYRMLNRYSSITEPLQSRIDRIARDIDRYNDSNPNIMIDSEIDFASIIATRGLDFTNAHYAKADGLYYDYLTIKKKTYPTEVVATWLNLITAFGLNVALDIHSEKQPRSVVVSELKNAIKFKSSAANTASITTVDELSDEFSHIHFMRNAIMSNDEDCYDVIMTITIIGNTPEELEKVKAAVKEKLEVAFSIKCANCFARHEEMMLATLPGMRPTKIMKLIGRRNFLTSSLASIYMFTINEIKDQGGFLLGTTDVANSSARTLAFTNMFDRRNHVNGNMALVGMSGAGKSYTLQIIARRTRILGGRVIVVAPVKGFEQRNSCASIGGSYINIAPASNDIINIFEIRPADDIDSEEDMIESPLSEQINVVKTIISLVMDGDKLTSVEKTQLGIYLLKLYDSFGITDNKESLYNADGTLKTMPIASDFYELIKDEPDLFRVATVFRTFIDGECRNFNGQTNIDLANKYIVFSLDGVPKDFLAAFMFIVTNFALTKIKENKEEEGTLIVDEIWKCLMVEEAGYRLLEAAKVLRGYNANLITATQELKDMLESTKGYGQSIINNASVKILLKCQSTEMDLVHKIVELSSSEEKELSTFSKGTAFYVADLDKIKIHFETYDKETLYFTTDAEERAKLMQRFGISNVLESAQTSKLVAQNHT